jgi:hypothetical protein
MGGAVCCFAVPFRGARRRASAARGLEDSVGELKSMRGFPVWFLRAGPGAGTCEDPVVQPLVAKDRRGALNQYGC